MPTTTRTFSWHELIQKVDDENRHIETNFPVVYQFGDSVRKRDRGAGSLIYGGTR